MGELLNTVKTFYERFGAGDLEGAVELFDPDIDDVSPTGATRGVDGFRATGEIFKGAFPDSGMTILSAIETEDTVVVEGLYAGTHTGTLATPMGDVPATGRAISLPYCDLFRFDGARIVAHHVYWDQVTFMTQLGLMPGGPPQEA